MALNGNNIAFFPKPVYKYKIEGVLMIKYWIYCSIIGQFLLWKKQYRWNIV